MTTVDTTIEIDDLDTTMTTTTQDTSMTTAKQNMKKLLRLHDSVAHVSQSDWQHLGSSFPLLLLPPKTPFREANEANTAWAHSLPLAPTPVPAPIPASPLAPASVPALTPPIRTPTSTPATITMFAEAECLTHLVHTTFDQYCTACVTSTSIISSLNALNMTETRSAHDATIADKNQRLSTLQRELARLEQSLASQTDLLDAITRPITDLIIKETKQREDAVNSRREAEDVYTHVEAKLAEARIMERQAEERFVAARDAANRLQDAVDRIARYLSASLSLPVPYDTDTAF